MPEPISSSESSNASQPWLDEPTGAAGAPPPPDLEVEAGASTLECSTPPTASEPPVAVKSIVDRFAPGSTVSFVQGSPSSEAAPHVWPSSNNATRTSERSNELSPYSASGKTSDGASWFAGAAALKTHVRGGPADGVEVEALTASVQLGPQSEAQLGLVRVGLATPLAVLDASVTAEALTLRANLGITNDDGSVGINFGSTAELAGFESTISRSGWSLTGGLSAQVGGYVSAGVRDADDDGQAEVCAKLSTPAVTIGACVEDPSKDLLDFGHWVVEGLLSRPVAR